MRRRQSVEGSGSKARGAPRELDRLSEATGGLAYHPAGLESLDDIALNIARHIRTQYTISYVPPAGGAHASGLLGATDAPSSDGSSRGNLSVR